MRDLRQLTQVLQMQRAHFRMEAHGVLAAEREHAEACPVPERHQRHGADMGSSFTEPSCRLDVSARAAVGFRQRARVLNEFRGYGAELRPYLGAFRGVFAPS